jgi:hypothetical protein
VSGKRIYQYGRLQNIELRAKSFVVEESGVPLSNVDIPHAALGPLRYGLVDATPSWQLLNFNVEFRLDEATLGAVLEDPTRLDAETKAVVSISCSSTKYRQGYALSKKEDGLWIGELRLPRNEARGLVVLTPYLIRSTATKTAEGFAHFEGAILADGDGIELAIDNSVSAPQGDFKYRYEKFSDSKHSDWLQSRSDDVFFVDARSTPQVYLNIRWQSLQTVLSNKAVTGVNAALRKAFGAVIGQDVWVQLLTTSVGSIVLDSDGSVHVVGDPWRSDLAAKVGQALFPEMDGDDRLRQLYATFRDPAEIGMLVSKIGSLAHDLTNTGKLLDQAAKYVDNERLLEGEP